MSFAFPLRRGALRGDASGRRPALGSSAQRLDFPEAARCVQTPSLFCGRASTPPPSVAGGVCSQSGEEDAKTANTSTGGGRVRRQVAFENGAVYTGEWLGDVRDGFGVQVGSLRGRVVRVGCTLRFAAANAMLGAFGGCRFGKTALATKDSGWQTRRTAKAASSTVRKRLAFPRPRSPRLERERERERATRLLPSSLRRSGRRRVLRRLAGRQGPRPRGVPPRRRLAVRFARV